MKASSLAQRKKDAKIPGIFTRLARALYGRSWKPQTIDEMDRAMDRSLGYGGASNAGVAVGEDDALTYSAWFSGVQQISQTVASMPLVLYRRKGEAKDRYSVDPLYYALHTKVNPYMSAFSFKEVMLYCMIVWGNFYAVPIYEEGRRGLRITELWPLDPSRVVCYFEEGKKKYKFLKANGTWIYFSHDEIFHVAGFGKNGYTGLSILMLAAESIGLGVAQEDFAARFFGTGTNVGGIFTYPGQLSPEAVENIKSTIGKLYSGLSNSHKFMVLEEGMTFSRTTMPLQDAQFLEGRVFSIQNVARFLNMPPHKLKDQSRSSFSNIESEQLSWWTDTIRPWVTRIESAINSQLIREIEQEKVFAEFLFDAILRADIKTRYEAYSTALQNGIMTRNEVRARENLNPIDNEGGDIFTVQLNLTNLKDVGKVPESIDTGVDTDDAGQGTADTDTTAAPAGPDDNDEQERTEFRSAFFRSLPEKRKRSVVERRRIQKRGTAKLISAFEKIVKRDVQALRKMVDNNLKSRTLRTLESFQTDLNSHYDSTFDEIYRSIYPVILAYARSVVVAAEAEMGNEIDIDIEEKVDKFTRNAIGGYVTRNKTQIINALEKDIESDILDYIEETRAVTVGNREGVGVAGYFAAAAFFAAGYRVSWVTVGENCPMCDEMDGKTIEKGNDFVSEGDRIGHMALAYAIAHPPLHGGCDCTVSYTGW
jgi:HK97 family phage portal protein